MNSVLLSLFAWSCLLVQYRLRRSSKDKVATGNYCKMIKSISIIIPVITATSKNTTAGSLTIFRTKIHQNRVITCVNSLMNSHS